MNMPSGQNDRLNFPFKSEYYFKVNIIVKLIEEIMSLNFDQ